MIPVQQRTTYIQIESVDNNPILNRTVSIPELHDANFNGPDCSHRSVALAAVLLLLTSWYDIVLTIVIECFILFCILEY